MLMISMKHNYNCVHAHDITALPIAYLISRTNKIPLIYDSHELWSESIHSGYPKVIIYIANKIECYLAKNAEYIFTVSKSIGDILKLRFKNEITSIPYIEMTLQLLKELGIEFSWEGDCIKIIPKS